MELYTLPYAPITGPATRCFAITPNDDVDLPLVTKSIYVGSGGDVVVLAADDSVAVVYKNMPSASSIYVRCKRILATGTTALDIVGEA